MPKSLPFPSSASRGRLPTLCCREHSHTRLAPAAPRSWKPSTSGRSPKSSSPTGALREGGCGLCFQDAEDTASASKMHGDKTAKQKSLKY